MKPKSSSNNSSGEKNVWVRLWPLWLFLFLMLIFVIGIFVVGLVNNNKIKELGKEIEKECNYCEVKQMEVKSALGNDQSLFGSTMELQSFLSNPHYESFLRLLLTNLCASMPCQRENSCVHDLCVRIRNIAQIVENEEDSKIVARPLPPNNVESDTRNEDSNTSSSNTLSENTLSSNTLSENISSDNTFSTAQKNQPEHRDGFSSKNDGLVWNPIPINYVNIRTENGKSNTCNLNDHNYLYPSISTTVASSCFSNNRVDQLMSRCIPLFSQLCYVSRESRFKSFCRRAILSLY